MGPCHWCCSTSGELCSLNTFLSRPEIEIPQELQVDLAMPELSSLIATSFWEAEVNKLKSTSHTLIHMGAALHTGDSAEVLSRS